MAGLTQIMVDRLSVSTGLPLGALIGDLFAWGVAALYLLIGAFSLRLVGPRGARDGEPLWFTPDSGRLVIVAVFIAVGEEAVFRGLLQGFLLSLLQPVYALFAVNALFALIHARGGLTFAMSAGFFGMIASVITLASGSLAPAIVMHVGWNLLIALARRRASALLSPSEA